MTIRPLSMIAVVGQGGVIGNVGHQPEFPDEESAMEFRAYTGERLKGSAMIVGGRAADLLVRAGYRPECVPWETFVWDRKLQSMMSPEELVDRIVADHPVAYVMGGAFTYQTFLPWVGAMTILRASLTVGDDPVYMPELFPKPM